MRSLVDHPIAIFLLSFAVLFIAAHAGDYVRRSFISLGSEQREDFGEVMAASLTLLGLLIGFSFSMAIMFYDERKKDEEAEANAIGTEFLRADLLPAADGARVRDLLRDYVGHRVVFYGVRRQDELEALANEKAKLQQDLWSSVLEPARANPTPITALVVNGMNDVINAEGFTQAAWRNRIPASAWMLMWLIASACNFLVGLHARKPGSLLFLVAPLVLATTFFLIADIDSPRGGLIRVAPQNLVALANQIKSK